MKKSLTSGFTLVELIVVVGIIGILTSVLLGFFSGSGEAAKSTQCMNNIRALTTAMISCAMQDDAHGRFPAAGDYKYTIYYGKLTYHDYSGWIAREPPSAKQVGDFIEFSAEDNFKDENATRGLRRALTAGRLWSHVGGARKVYQCPVHANECLKKNNRLPGWSYVVNSRFAWASGGKEPLMGLWTVSHGSFGSGAERVLMFAEIQGITDSDYELTANLDGKNEAGDSVLQYGGSHNEVIGFNHRQKTGGWIGHVSFCDGHVQKLIVPKKGLNIRELTQRLCDGWEIASVGSQYRDVSGTTVKSQDDSSSRVEEADEDADTK